MKMYYGVVMSMSLVSNSSSASSIVHVASDSVQRKHTSPCRRLEKRIAKSLPVALRKKKARRSETKKTQSRLLGGEPAHDAARAFPPPLVALRRRGLGRGHRRSHRRPMRHRRRRSRRRAVRDERVPRRRRTLRRRAELLRRRAKRVVAFFPGDERVRPGPGPVAIRRSTDVPQRGAQRRGEARDRLRVT